MCVRPAHKRQHLETRSLFSTMHLHFSSVCTPAVYTICATTCAFCTVYNAIALADVLWKYRMHLHLHCARIMYAVGAHIDVVGARVEYPLCALSAPVVTSILHWCTVHVAWISSNNSILQCTALFVHYGSTKCNANTVREANRVLTGHVLMTRCANSAKFGYCFHLSLGHITCSSTAIFETTPRAIGALSTTVHLLAHVWRHYCRAEGEHWFRVVILKCLLHRHCAMATYVTISLLSKQFAVVMGQYFRVNI